MEYDKYFDLYLIGIIFYKGTLANSKDIFSPKILMYYSFSPEINNGIALSEVSCIRNSMYLEIIEVLICI